MDLEAYLAAKKGQEEPKPVQPAPTAPVTIDKPKKPISTRKFGGSSDDDDSDEDFAPSKKTTTALANKPLPKIGGSKPKPSVAFKDDDDDGGDDWKPKAAPADKKKYRPSLAFFEQDSDD